MLERDRMAVDVRLIAAADFRGALLDGKAALASACFRPVIDDHGRFYFGAPPRNLPEGVDPPAEHCGAKKPRE